MGLGGLTGQTVFDQSFLFKSFHYVLLPPANEVCEGYVFTGVCLSTRRVCMVAPVGGGWGDGGHAWLLRDVCVVALGGMHGCLGGGGMRGCSRGLCMVARGGHAWLLLGGMHACSQGGACMLAPGGACMVAPGGAGGHAWLLRGCGMCGCSWGGGGVCMEYDEIRRYDQ